MEFELKNAVPVGDVKSKDEKNYLQYLNITVGIVGCPYDMVETKTVEYVLSNDLSVQDVKNGVIPFATEWVKNNYPTI